MVSHERLRAARRTKMIQDTKSRMMLGWSSARRTCSENHDVIVVYGIPERSSYITYTYTYTYIYIYIYIYMITYMIIYVIYI